MLISNTITYQNLLGLRPETIQWLNQKSNNLGQTIEQLVANAQNGVEEATTVQEELEITREQVKTLQQQLQDYQQTIESYQQDCKDLKTELYTCVIANKLGYPINTLDLITPMKVLAKQLVTSRTSGGKLLIPIQHRLAVKNALIQFISVLLK